MIGEWGGGGPAPRLSHSFMYEWESKRGEWVGFGGRKQNRPAPYPYYIYIYNNRGGNRREGRKSKLTLLSSSSVHTRFNLANLLEEIRHLQSNEPLYPLDQLLYKNQQILRIYFLIWVPGYAYRRDPTKFSSIYYIYCVGSWLRLLEASSWCEDSGFASHVF